MKPGCTYLCGAILTKRGTFKQTVAAAAISEKAKDSGVGEPGTHDYSINVRK